MKASKAKMWCGILSPVWLVLGLFVLYPCHSTGIRILDFLVVIGLYGGTGLFLSYSGIRSGHIAGILFGILA
jgi:hypothetical protein